MLKKGLCTQEHFIFQQAPILTMRLETRFAFSGKQMSLRRRESNGETHENSEGVLFFPSPKRIQEHEISGLKPETPYFYQIIASNETGEEISSGILTFSNGCQ